MFFSLVECPLFSCIFSTLKIVSGAHKKKQASGTLVMCCSLTQSVKVITLHCWSQVRCIRFMRWSGGHSGFTMAVKALCDHTGKERGHFFIDPRRG